MAPSIIRMRHLLLGDRDLPLVRNDRSVATGLPRSLAQGEVRIGDTVLVGLDEPATPTSFAAVVAGTDPVLRRSAEVWDLYDSTLGQRLLDACDCTEPAHHTQVRFFAVGGAAVSQVAIYPQPRAIAGVRMWCDPALVVIAVEDTAFDDLLVKLCRVQPLWERLRAHHGAPLLTRIKPALANAYPVPERLAPLDQREWHALQKAVRLLRDETPVDDLLSLRQPPVRVVERMLAARRELQRHDERIIHLLQHSHGSVEDKYDALDELLTVVFADDAATMSAYHLGAPHRHLMQGFKETRTDVRALTDRASASASLVVSATVGRLLDRSEANKTTGTAVGAALAIIALVSTFTAVASVPSERSGTYLTRLAGWVGFSGLLVGAFVMLLAWVANRPAVEVAFPGRRVRRTFGAVVLVGALGSFAFGAAHANLTFVVLGAAAVVVVSLMYAALNDFR